MRPEGVYVASVTPFTSDGKVDFSALEKHLNFLADGGVHGIVPCGTTGEAVTLRRDEWRDVVALAKRVGHARGLKVMAGCGSNCTETATDLIKEAFEIGVDSALVVTPYYNKPTQAGLLAHYEYLAQRSRLPIVLYNVPSRTNVCLSLETTLKLFELPNIVGIKEASGNPAFWTQLALKSDLKTKALLAGDDDAFAQVLSLGGSGIISTSANLIPKEFVALYDAVKAGNWDAAFLSQKRIAPLTQVMFMETNPQPLKYALSRMGRIENSLRLPLVPVTPASQSAIEIVLRNQGLIA